MLLGSYTSQSRLSSEAKKCRDPRRRGKLAISLDVKCAVAHGTLWPIHQACRRSASAWAGTAGRPVGQRVASCVDDDVSTLLSIKRQWTNQSHQLCKVDI